MGVGGQRHTLATLHTGKRPYIYGTGGWVGPVASLDGCGKSHPIRIQIQSPDHPATSESHITNDILGINTDDTF